MNIAVTIQARSGEHLVGRRGPLESFEAGIRIDRVIAYRSNRIMATLAKQGHSTVQELVVIPTMRHMADETILVHRRMGPHEGASFFGMALVAELVHRIGLEEVGAEPAVMLMAVGAFHLPFPDRMVGGPIFLSPYPLMTEITEVRLGSLQIFPGAGMDGMAVVAGNPFGLVPGQVPEGEVSLLAVAGEAFGRFGSGVGEPFAENKDSDPAFAALLHMGGAGAMTGFAAFLVRRRAGQALLGVGGEQVGLKPVLMASLTNLRPDVPPLSPSIPGC